MDIKEMNALILGQIVISRDGHRFVVVMNDAGGTVTVVRAVNLTDPKEWTLKGAPLESIVDLRCSDIVQNVPSGQCFFVATVASGSNGNRATGVIIEEIDFSNYTRWTTI